MKWNRKNTSKVLFSLFSLIILFFIGVLIYQIQKAKDYITTETSLCLQASIKNFIEHKSKGIYYAAQYEYDPSKKKLGEYEIRTVKYADTVLDYRSKVVDPGEDAFRRLQTLFVDINQLHADSIQFLFDSLLQEKDIHAKSIVGITASFYTKKNEWSGDTTAIHTNYRTAITNQGRYEDINYYAYLRYSPYTLWTLMPKKAISILFICSIMMGVILLWWHRKRKEEEKNEIALLKNGNYRIREFIFNVSERTLVSKESKKETPLPRQLNDLLLLFLRARHHRVNKEDIKQKFWPKSTTAITNMTSAVTRLNKILKDADCPYSIITDSKNEERYLLQLQEIFSQKVSPVLPNNTTS